MHDTTLSPFEASLARRLRAHAEIQVAPANSRDIAHEVMTRDARRRRFAPYRTLRLALVLALVAATIGAALYVAGRLMEQRPVIKTSLVAGGKLAEWVSNPIALRLNDGRVLTTGGISFVAQIYDPASGNTVPVGDPSPFHPAAALLLPDGRVFFLAVESLIGGESGRSVALLFDPRTNSFSDPVPTFHTRYQGSVAKLADGRVLVSGGTRTSRRAPPSPRRRSSTPRPAASPRAGRCRRRGSSMVRMAS